MGYSSRSGEYTRSRYCATLPHRKPCVTGCEGSPSTFTARSDAAPSAPVSDSTVTSTPHESGQSCEHTACTTFVCVSAAIDTILEQNCAPPTINGSESVSIWVESDIC